MPRRPKVPPAEVSLAKVAASIAEVNASIAEMQRDRKRDAAKRKAERAADRAERKREAAERKAEREAEREADRAERKREIAEREAAERKREAEREAEREAAERKREAAERKREAEREAAERKREAKREAAERKRAAEREAERAADRAEREAAEAASKARFERIEAQAATIRGEWGSHTSDESEDVEDQVYNALDESKQIGDIRFDHVDQKLRNVVDGKSCEYDIVAENGKVTVVLEVKHKLTLSDVRRFAKKHLPLFNKAFPNLARNKDVIGAMAYQSIRERKKTVQEALDFGLLLLRAEGKKGLRQIKTIADSDRPSKRGK